MQRAAVNIWKRLGPVRSRRLFMNLTMKELAALCGFGHHVVWSVESGRKIGERSAHLLAAQFGMLPKDLIREVNEWREDRPTAEGAEEYIRRWNKA